LRVIPLTLFTKPQLTPLLPFLHTLQTQHATGTGLGLFSLRKRIEALGGLCGVHDRDDSLPGVVFWFTFPYRPDLTRTTQTALSQAARTRAQTAHSDEVSHDVLQGTDKTDKMDKGALTPVDSLKYQTLPPLRVLVTDDHPPILKLTTRFLEANKHTVVTADNGDEALEQLKKDFGRFDLSIMDLQVQCKDSLSKDRKD
jgi:hypothetical protein